MEILNQVTLIVYLHTIATELFNGLEAGAERVNQQT